MKKGNKIYSIINNKCPRCNEGHFFNSNNPYSLKNFDKMDKTCSVCSLKHEPEPGFYYGAMYVGYAINVAIFVTLWLGIEIFKTSEVSLLWYIIIIIVPNLLLVPLIFRLSRLIWINFFVKFDIKYCVQNNIPSTLK